VDVSRGEVGGRDRAQRRHGRRIPEYVLPTG
jgi:hypothetical protein